MTFWELLPLNEHRHHSSFVSIELENTYFNTKGRECKLQSRNLPALVLFSNALQQRVKNVPSDSVFSLTNPTERDRAEKSRSYP